MPSAGRPPGRAPISPRVRLAARMYATGAVATKREASEAAGLHPSYFTLVSSPGHQMYNPEVTELMDEIDRQIHDKTVDMSTILQAVGREALSRMRDLMKTSKNEAIIAKTAADLLDRSPETSKIQKHQVASFSLDGEDAKMLAAAMVRSAEARLAYGEAAEGDFVRVPLRSDTNQPEESQDAGQGLLPSAPGQVDEGLGAGASAVGSGQVDPADSEHPAGSAEVGSAPQEPETQGPIIERQLRLLKDEP